jgi:hypothetical protein
VKTGWLTHAGPYRVEHLPLRNPGALLPAAYTHRKGVQHTTEGPTIEGALSRFKAEEVESTFIVGRDAHHNARIIQMVPLGNAAAALQNRGGGVETNRIVIAQIELAGFSKTTPWLPDDGVLARLAALYWQLEQSCGIPLKRVANPKRAAAKWNGAAGWLGHADVPENDHVDPRALRYASTPSGRCRSAVAPPRSPPRPRPPRARPRRSTTAAPAARTPPGSAPTPRRRRRNTKLATLPARSGSA